MLEVSESSIRHFNAFNIHAVIVIAIILQELDIVMFPVMNVIKTQFLAFGGSVLSVMTLTYALTVIWRENTTVITHFYVTPFHNIEGNAW